jgi:hypothetical protein
MAQNYKKDFNGQNIFVGIDVHLNDTPCLAPCDIRTDTVINFGLPGDHS